MANLKQYAYFLKGNKIAIVENDITPENDPTSRDYGPDINKSQWKSPRATISNGLELEYAYSPEDEITDESSTIPLPSYLAKALVDYVRHKMLEDAGELEMSMFYRVEFQKKIEKYENSKVAGPRRVIPGGHAIR